MTVEAAGCLMVGAVMGLVLAGRFLRQKRALRIVCMVLLSAIALGCALYIGLAVLLVAGLQNQPPTP